MVRNRSIPPDAALADVPPAAAAGAVDIPLPLPEPSTMDNTPVPGPGSWLWDDQAGAWVDNFSNLYGAPAPAPHLDPQE